MNNSPMVPTNNSYEFSLSSDLFCVASVLAPKVKKVGIMGRILRKVVILINQALTAALI